jgi:hypothetical protein
MHSYVGPKAAGYSRVMEFSEPCGRTQRYYVICPARFAASLRLVHPRLAPLERPFSGRRDFRSLVRDIQGIIDVILHVCPTVLVTT